MRKNMKQIELIANELQTTGTGYDLLRYAVLPDLLGKDAPAILYIMGKNLARELSLQSIEQMIEFFYKTGWGTLELIKETRSEHIFKLQTRIISERSRLGIEADYRLETGFLAAAMEQVLEHRCECTEEEKTRKNYIELRVQRFR